MIRETEQSLIELGEKYNYIIDKILDVIIEVDAKGKFVYLSPQVYGMFGFRPEELIGLSVYKMIHPDDLSHFNESINKGINLEDTLIGEFRVKHKKGYYIHVSIKGSMVKENSAFKIIGIIRDITERWEAEQKLKESEKKYREILHNIKEGYFENDFKGNYTFVNDYFCKALRYSREELLGKNFRSMYTKSGSEEIYKKFNQLYKNEISPPLVYENQLITQSGEIMYYEALVDLKYDSDGNKVGFSGLIRDITERKIAEQKLKESERRYRGILENIKEGYFENDLKGNLTFINDYYCKILGCSREEVLGQNYRLRYTEKRTKKLFKLYNQLYNNEISSPLVLEEQLLTKSGELYYYEFIVDLKYDSEGKKVGFFGLIRDVTERKAAEQKLKESERSLKERIKEINCLYAISRFIEKPFKSVDEIIQDTLDLIPSAWQFPDLTCARIFFNNMEFKTKNFKETQWKLSTHTKINTKELTIEVNYLKNKPFLEEEEDLTKDIINRLKIIIEKKQAEENLQQFISIVSHELRTPITVLVQSTDVLNKYKDKLSKEKKKEINEMISRNISLLYDLVDDLLVTSRLDEKKVKLTWREYQPLNLIMDIIELMEPRRAAKQITIEVYVDKEIQLWGDTRRISQIFRILIDNAIKYSHENSKIVINTIDHYKGKYNSYGIDGILFQFRDSGIGIRQDDLPNLFQRFFRAKNVEKISGTGLGLNIAKDLVKLHDGEIFVESKYEKGSTFSVFLPYLKNI